MTLNHINDKINFYTGNQSPYHKNCSYLKITWSRNFITESDKIFSGIVLCEIIGRVDPDPDYLPRTTSFGLAVAQYYVQFALKNKCPQYFFAIAVTVRYLWFLIFCPKLRKYRKLHNRPYFSLLDWTYFRVTPGHTEIEFYMWYNRREIYPIF